MTITTVLVPVDFSPPSILAVSYGIAFARKVRAQLLLLHVLSDSDNDERRNQVSNALSSLVCPEDQDDLDLLVLVKAGDVNAQIRSAVREHASGIVIMGTHGRRLLGRLLIGSVTDELIRKMTVPLMTVCHATRPLEFNRLLFATDLSEPADKVFKETLELAHMLEASLLVLHVTVAPVTLYQDPEMMGIAEKARAAYRKEMEAKLARLVSIGLKEDVLCEAILQDGDPAVEILKTAADRSADLIVLGITERGAIDRAVFGSSAEAVIRSSQVPVLSLHIPKHKPAAA